VVALNWRQSLVAFLIVWKQKCQGINRTVSSYPTNRQFERMFSSVKIASYVPTYKLCMTELNELTAISVSRCVFLIPQLTFKKCTNKFWIILQFIPFTERQAGDRICIHEDCMNCLFLPFFKQTPLLSKMPIQKTRWIRV